MALTDITFTSNSNSWYDMILGLPIKTYSGRARDITFGSKFSPTKLILETFLSREIIIITIN